MLGQVKQIKGQHKPKTQLPVKLREIYLLAHPLTKTLSSCPSQPDRHCKRCGGNIVTSYGERGCLQCGEPAVSQPLSESTSNGNRDK